MKLEKEKQLKREEITQKVETQRQTERQDRQKTY